MFAHCTASRADVKDKNCDGYCTVADCLGTPCWDRPPYNGICDLGTEDINGDGLPDIVCGKRRWAHGIKGDDEPNAEPVQVNPVTPPNDPALLYWICVSEPPGVPAPPPPP